MTFEKNFAGEDAFVWFMGVVESRKDPLALGRVQVRVFGTHTPLLSEIPSGDLPWAHPCFAFNDQGFSTPKEADVVFGFFADGPNKQIPIILGTIPGFATLMSSMGQGFGDLRQPSEIALAPKKPVDRTYATDGSGIKLTEANTASSAVLESLRTPQCRRTGSAVDYRPVPLPESGQYSHRRTQSQSGQECLDSQ